MARNLSASFLASLDEEPLVPAIAAYFDFLGDPVFAWTGPNEISWDPGDGVKAWKGLEGAAQFDWLQETSDTRITSVKCSLSYVPNETLPSLNTAEWKDRESIFYLWLFDKDDLGAEPVDGHSIFTGIMDTLSVKVEESHSIVELSVANELVRMKQSWGAMYTDSDQKSRFPTDTALRFMQSMQDVRIEL